MVISNERIVVQKLPFEDILIHSIHVHDKKSERLPWAIYNVVYFDCVDLGAAMFDIWRIAKSFLILTNNYESKSSRCCLAILLSCRNFNIVITLKVELVHWLSGILAQNGFFEFE